MTKTVELFALLVLGLALTGCPEKKEGPMENAGEKLDEAADDVDDAVDDALAEVEDAVDPDK